MKIVPASQAAPLPAPRPSGPPAPLPPSTSAEEVEGLSATMARAKADNTRRAYRKVMRKVLRWVTDQHPECLRLGADWPDNVLPLSPETLALFLRYVRVDPPVGWKPGDPEPPRPTTSTLAQYLSVIRSAHDHRGLPDPGDSPMVREVWQGIKNTEGVRQQGADPLRLEQLRRVVAACDQHEDPDRAVRDRALILIGFFGAFRRSELAALTVQDMSTDDEGLLLLVRRSKTDQEGRGVQIEIPRLPQPSGASCCPVEALEEWRLALDRLDAESVRGTPEEGRPIDRTPLFRSWTLDGSRLRPSHMSDRGVNFVFQAAVERAKLVGKLSAHSLRAGFATEAARLEVGLERLMEQGRWKTPGIALRYIRERRRGMDGAAGRVGKALAALGDDEDAR